MALSSEAIAEGLMNFLDRCDRYIAVGLDLDVLIRGASLTDFNSESMYVTLEDSAGTEHLIKLKVEVCT